MKPFLSWGDLEAWLDGLGMFHMELGLERMEELLKRLGLSSLPFPVIQVLGTNGKGSTASFLAALGKAHGLRCGLFLSPHFVSIRERITINGKAISEHYWLEGANLLLEAADDSLQPTYFEFLTALAALLFSRLGVDMAVFEAGLGGRNDATSVISASFHCFTPIDLDHVNIIGPGLDDIARDKACAIKYSTSVFSAPQQAQVQKILESACTAKNSSLSLVMPDPSIPSPGLQGFVQKTNASLALAAWRAFADKLGLNSSPVLEKLAIRKAFIPGRLQLVPASGRQPTLILDGAHNPHAMGALLESLPQKPAVIVFSALADKDWPASMELLNRHLPAVPMFIPHLGNKRAADPPAMAEKRAAYGNCSLFFGNDASEKTLQAASELALGRGGPVLVTGSLYLLAEFFKHHPQLLETEDW